MTQRLLRRLAATGLGLGASAVAVLAAEAVAASYRPYLQADSAPAIEGTFGDDSLPSLRLVLLGDSTAAGVGAVEPVDTVGARLAEGLSDGWQVTLTSVAVSGSRVGDLGPQVSRALLLRPDVAVVLIGANDATHVTSMRSVARHLEAAVTRLRDTGVAVVVGTCPDMGARAFLQPLREVVAWQGRRVAAASAVAVHRGGGSVVGIGELCGPVFHSDPTTLSTDAFHPSARGYQVWADALLPAVRRAADLQMI